MLGFAVLLVAAAVPPIPAQVEQAARAQLDKQFSASGLAEPRFELTVVAARASAPCAVPVEVEPLDTRQPARMRFAVRCPTLAPQAGARQEFVVRAKVSALVAVTAAPIAANDVVTGAQVTLERRDITSVSDPVPTLEAAVGQTSRRSLRAGELLRASQLSAPVLVKRGDAVVMVAREDEIEVSTSGEAMDSGARGATIRVRNLASGVVVRMRVSGAGTVEPVGTARISP
ncbi:MAG: flagellar basal body P-ring formation chaperone FlgA [Gammaproteobacteria bacterium]